MHGITLRQSVVLRFIDRHLREKGCPPTLREIGEELCIRSNNGVKDHLDALETKGYLVRRERLARATQLTDKAREYLARDHKETAT
jgi:repressor LexA